MKVQLHPAYVVHPELLAAVEAVNASIERAKKIREIVDEAVKTVTSLTAEEAALKQEIAGLQVDEALAEDGGTKKALRKTIDGKKADLATKTADLASAQLKIVELEKRAPSVDAEVSANGVILQSEYQAWIASTKTVLAADIDEVIKPLVDAMAKARAVGWRHNMSFLDDALVPDLLTYVSVQHGAARASDLSTNRLKGKTPSAEAQAAVAQIRELIQPVEQALTAVKSHRPYETVESRQKSPYVMKGWGSAYHARTGSPAPEAEEQA